ncbi:ATP-binding protein [Oryzomicrobium sp.]|uniref:sensor histidine kinase n=1 Tax=Oryzomicrobium sp. TaxID=1911578 RepID=UPI00342183F8
MTDADRMTEVKAEELQRAFSVFNQVSQELTQAYEALQGQVVRLTAELEVANGKLRRQFQEKEALSERLSLLLNALPAGVVAVDGSGGVTSTNPAAREMLGRDAAGLAWREVAAQELRPSVTPGEWCCGERRLSMAESPLDSAGGRIVLLHDITAAHAMKASLERSQRLAAMGEMAASLAHQLRTPLATALLYSSNLGKPDLAADARVRFADKATTQLKRLERLIQDVLLFARGESIGRDVVPLDALVQEASLAVEALMRRQGVAFAVEGEAPGMVAMGDHKALSGALINLLENALQACERGGEAARVSLTLAVTGGRARIAVRDTGPGLAPEMISRIFEPFFTTRGQGTGLGLAIALGVARAHGGTIDVSSTPGQGAEFVLELPAGPAPAGVAGEEN